MNCKWIRNGDLITCSECEFSQTFIGEESRFFRNCSQSYSPEVIEATEIESGGATLIGDFISDSLKQVGISSAGVSKWLGRPCGCEDRRKKLNALHKWASELTELGLEKAKLELYNILR